MNDRNVWVNAIGYKHLVEQFPNGQAISLGVYRYSGQFRIPLLPAPDINQRVNAGGIHAVVLFWDGRGELITPDSQSRDFALYWQLNPWRQGIDYGDIYVYTGPNFDLHKTGITVAPDTEWHSFETVMDFRTMKWVSVRVDGIAADISDVEVALVDRSDWSADGRVVIGLTVESLATWPGADCSTVFAWTTHYREVEFSILQ